jgi:hypothetical protein
MLPHFIVKDELERNLLEELDGKVEHNSLEIYTAIHKDKWVSRSMDVFFSMLEKSGK